MTENADEKISHPKSRRSILFQPSKKGCLLLDQKKNRIHSLNETAAFIWTFCDGKHTVADIEEALRDHWKGAPEKIEREVVQTLLKFKTLELLE